MSVTINSPKTPVTEGSQGISAATLPNVCKMPGPPAPFVPTPLPNIGRSSDSLKGATTSVTIEGKKVAIKGASFGSQGDIASKGTGGGLVSATTHGTTKFASPGSMDVKFEGKNAHLLSDAMTNNNSNPPNASTLPGIVQAPGAPPFGENPFLVKCEDAPATSSNKFGDCDKKQICAKVDELNKLKSQFERPNITAPERVKRRRDGNQAAQRYKARLGNSLRGVGEYGRKLEHSATPEDLKDKFTHECAHKEWVAAGSDPKMPGLSADHVHEIQLGGSPTDPSNLLMMSSRSNEWMGRTLYQYEPDKHSGLVADCCD